MFSRRPQGLGCRRLPRPARFLVSAGRKAGQTAWVRVKSLAGEPCRIKPGIVGDVKVVSFGKSAALKLLGDGVYELDLAKGEQALLHAGDAAPAIIIAPMPAAAAADCNAWGLKRAGASAAPRK